MKKTLITVLCLFVSFGKVMACEIPTEQNYMHLSLAISYNDIRAVDYLNKKYCFNYFQNKTFSNSPLMQVNEFEEFKLLVKNTNSDDLNRKVASSFNENLLVSRMLLPTLSTKVKDEMEKEINTVKAQYGYTSPLPNLNQKENDKIIYYLAANYHGSISNFFDAFDNTPLFYAILTNRSEILGISITLSEGKSTFYRPNKDGITPLHLLFSPEVKNKDMSKMNDEILKRIDAYKLLKVDYHGVDYFQFATVMKNNNPDLFNKLRKQYQFDTKITPSVINIVNTMSLDYINKANLIYEKNR